MPIFDIEVDVQEIDDILRKIPTVKNSLAWAQGNFLTGLQTASHDRTPPDEVDESGGHWYPGGPGRARESFQAILGGEVFVAGNDDVGTAIFEEGVDNLGGEISGRGYVKSQGNQLVGHLISVDYIFENNAFELSQKQIDEGKEPWFGLDPSGSRSTQWDVSAGYWSRLYDKKAYAYMQNIDGIVNYLVSKTSTRMGEAPL